MIPGVLTYHPRSAWERPGERIAEHTNAIQRWSQVFRPVVHYTAAENLPDGDPGENADQLPRYLANIQHYYVTDPTRGYSVGYLFAIDWLGGVWELRGFDYRSAANSQHNHYTAPILFLVDGDDRATDLAATSARAVWRECRRRSLRTDFEQRPWGHGELRERTGTGTQTPCPGGGLRAQIASGQLDLDYLAQGGEGTMPKPVAPLVGGPIRAYDSRPSQQSNVHPDLRAANADVPLRPLDPGVPRRVVVGLANSAEVVVHFQGRAGWVKVSGTATVPKTALTQADSDGGVSATGTFHTPEGAIYVTSLKGGDFQVDVNALG